MGGKYNYNQPKTLKKIRQLIQEYQVSGVGKSHVIYVFDKDLNTQDPRDAEFVEDVIQYAKENGYSIIWFVRTVEEVMWGSKVSKREKPGKAIQFIRKHQIERVIKNHLESGNNTNSVGKSNILTIINTYTKIAPK